MPSNVTTSLTSTRLWDRLGTGLSLLCAVHCVLLPVALPVLATTGATWLSHASVHGWMAVFIVPVSLLAALPAWRQRRRPGVLMLFGLGVLLVLGALAAEPLVGATGHTVLTLLGGVLLVAGHVRNGHHRHDEVAGCEEHHCPCPSDA